MPSGLAVLVVVAALALWIVPSRQTSSAQDGDPARPAPLISRGYTDAPAGHGGDRRRPGRRRRAAVELRVKDGQKVKKDEVVAVLSNYSRADVTVRTAEAELDKAKQTHEAMVKGYRVAEIAMQEVVAQVVDRANSSSRPCERGALGQAARSEASSSSTSPSRASSASRPSCAS